MSKDPLDPAVIAEVRSRLPLVAQRTVAAVIEQVPRYAAGLDPAMAANIEGAVQSALRAFLGRISSDRGPSSGPAPGLDAAYALGRGEARSGRPIDVLLAAYRVGARASWAEMSTTLVEHGASTLATAELAGGIFDYIDELSAASVAGHTDELAKSGRARAQYIEALGRALLDGQDPERLAVRADRAGWAAPETLTAVILPAAQVQGASFRLDPRTLVIAGDAADQETSLEMSVLLVPDAHRNRAALLHSLEGRSATVGPSRPWTDAAISYHRAMRTAGLELERTGNALDTDTHLVSLVLRADEEALRDLQAVALAPLGDLRPAMRQRLQETLLSWLLHQGRREAVASDLHVHAQTVRYRMTKLRELYGDQLTSPDAILRLVLALASLAPERGTRATTPIPSIVAERAASSSTS